MTMTRPWRLMTLQLSHIFLTLARTFTAASFLRTVSIRSGSDRAHRALEFGGSEALGVMIPGEISGPTGERITCTGR